MVKKLWKEFDQLKEIDHKYYWSSYYDVSVNKYGVKCGTSLRFWENKGWINEIARKFSRSKFFGLEKFLEQRKIQSIAAIKEQPSKILKLSSIVNEAIRTISNIF